MPKTKRLGLVSFGLSGAFAVALAACGSNSPDDGASSSAAGATSGAGASGSSATGSGGASSGTNGSGGTSNATSSASSGTGGGGPPPSASCMLPIQPVDVSKPTTVVGTGTAASCTEQAFGDAVK